MARASLRGGGARPRAGLKAAPVAGPQRHQAPADFEVLVVALLAPDAEGAAPLAVVTARPAPPVEVPDAAEARQARRRCPHLIAELGQRARQDDGLDHAISKGAAG